MRRSTVGYASVAIIALGVVGLAFVVAPRACAGGFELYFWIGCTALLVLLALPFATRIGHSVLARASWGLGFIVVGAAAWLLGLFGANVRFICGLGYL